jgi:nitrogen regulatory protein P-II 1
MKKIEAIIQPAKLRDVERALEDAGVGGLTVSEVRGHGRQRGHPEVYRGQEYDASLLRKIKIEVVVGDRDAHDTIEAILRSARTGRIGDGKIFVIDLEQVLRIRNSNLNDAAV